MLGQIGKKRLEVRKRAIDQLLNFGIIVISYFLAVIIRYYLLRPDHAIDPLSLPFLIIMLMYSALMAVSIDYEEVPRSIQGNEIFTSVYQIISKNMIGTLVLASVFFVTGIMNFSRWALFLFWIFSSIGLITKRIAYYSITARKRCAGLDVRNVVIVGDGNLAEDYIRAITNNPQFGIRIIGYYGTNDHLQTNLKSWFEPEKYPFPTIKWLGEYNVETIKEVKDIDEIIVADLNESENRDITDDLLKTGMKVCISLPFSKHISHGSISRDLGDAKLIGAKEEIQLRDYSKAGMIISVALLLIILLIKKTDLSAMDPAYVGAGIQKIRSVLFALFGFSLFWAVSDKLSRTSHGLIKSVILTLLCCITFIVLYELIYSDMFWPNVLVDVIPTVIVVGVFFGVKEIIKVFAKSFSGE